MSDLDGRMRSLGDAAGSRGRLPGMAELHRRSVFRRRRQAAVTTLAVVAVVGGGAAFGLSGLNGPGRAQPVIPAPPGPSRVVTTPPPSTTTTTAPTGLRIPDGPVLIKTADARGDGDQPLFRMTAAGLLDARGTASSTRARFRFERAGTAPGAYRIRSGDGCLAANEFGEVKLAGCSGSAAQRFTLTPERADGSRFTAQSQYGPVTVGNGGVYIDVDSDPWVLTTVAAGA